MPQTQKDLLREQRCAAEAHRLGNAAGNVAAFTVTGAQLGNPLAGFVVGLGVAAFDDAFGSTPFFGDIGATVLDGGSPSTFIGQQYGNAFNRVVGPSFPGIGRIGQDVASNLVANALRSGSLVGSARAARFGLGASAAYFGAYFATAGLVASQCLKD
jgi:hypothetical protein